MALDIGDRRIGIAVSDPFGEYAMPCDTYFRTRDLSSDAAGLAKIAEGKGVGEIVCGLPLNAEGNEGEQAEKTRRFVAVLAEKTSLPIAWEDERFTTAAAREVQIMGGVKRGDRKRTIDSIAASYILESYLARRKKQQRNGEAASAAEEDKEG